MVYVKYVAFSIMGLGYDWNVNLFLSSAPQNSGYLIYK